MNWGGRTIETLARQTILANLSTGFSARSLVSLLSVRLPSPSRLPHRPAPPSSSHTTTTTTTPESPRASFELELEETTSEMARSYDSRASAPSLNSPRPSDVYHRPMPTLRSSSPAPNNVPRLSPLLPQKEMGYYPSSSSPQAPIPTVSVSGPPARSSKDDSPVICGMPLKYLSSVHSLHSLS